jgi:acetyl esterase
MFQTPPSGPNSSTAPEDSGAGPAADAHLTHRETGLARVPVWLWKVIMTRVAPGELHKFNADPIDAVDYHFDLDYVSDGIRDHRLDVLVPHDDDARHHDDTAPLPVYIYFHGGGWTSGDKAPLTKYAASQAVEGMVVVNANYRMATRFTIEHMMHDANDVLSWVASHIHEYGGDPTRIIIGGDSAGGHIAALLTAAANDAELAGHYGIVLPIEPGHLRGLVQHCSIADFSVLFERGFVLSLNFLRMLLPDRGRGVSLRTAARFLSPIEWLDKGFPPVFVTTSERDYFYRANLNFIEALHRRSLTVDTLIYGRHRTNTRHTWQQDSRHPESQEVYRRLGSFVRTVAGLSTGTKSLAVVA